MKKIFYAIIMLATAGAWQVPAQPEDGFPPGPPPIHDRFQGGPRMAPPGFQPASPLHRIMQEMRQNNPEEFNRLQALRMNDPAAFRKEARVIVQQAMLEKIKGERPAIHDALSRLSEEDRDWLFDRISGPLFGGSGRLPPGMEKVKRGDDDRDINRGLIRKYRQSDSAEERDAIREQLRRQLSDQYDQRLEERKAQIDEAEQKLTQVKKSLEQGLADKESFIDDKLTIWLQNEPQAPRKPREEF